MEHKKRNEEEEKIEHLLEAIPRAEESPDALLDRMFEQHPEPTARTRESLAALHRRLGLPPLEELRDEPSRRRPTVVRFKRWMAAAVVIPLAMLGGAALWLSLRDTTPPSTMVEVQAGPEGVVTLPDGSTVRPVGRSRVTIASDFATRRHVVLTGEAFFSVTPNPERPFTVDIGELTVTVLGTEFNLSAWPDKGRSVVSVVSGSVRIEGNSGTEILKPMERLVYDTDTNESAVEQFTPDKIDRWRSGRRHVDSRSLGEGLNEVAAFYCMNMVIEEALPPELGITTTLSEVENVETALDAISAVHGVFKYRIEADTIYIVGIDR